MAEAAGLSLSVVSVATLFSAFFDTVERIRQLRGSSGDVKEAIEALDVEQKRLLWIRDKYKTDQLEEAEPMLAVMLNLIVKELNIITAVIDKYESRTSSGEWTKSKVIRPIAWITKDKTEVAGRLSKLHSWVDSLCSLAASESERLARDYLVRAEAVSTFDDENLERLESLNTDLYADISKAARVKRLLLRSAENSTIKEGATKPAHLVPFESIQWLQADGQNSSLEGLWSMGKCRLSSRGQSDIPILVEWRDAFMDGRQQSTEARLDGLRDLLHAMYTAEADSTELASWSESKRQVDFGVLECLGWTRTSISYDRLGLVFKLPTQHLPRPKSLNSVIEISRQQKKQAPPLGKRFDMAFGVASAMANIVAVGWLHRAVRSENMLSLDGQSSRVFLIGFTYSRPDGPSQEFSNLPQQPDWERYRPMKASPRRSEDGNSSDDEDNQGDGPDSKTETSTFGTAAADMYGLGVVLIEIGLWRTARSLAKDANQFRTSRMKEFFEQLSPRCGDVYCDVIRRCLDGRHWGTDKLKENLADLLADLKSCHA